MPSYTEMEINVILVEFSSLAASYQNDNFQCSQWRKFRQNDIFGSVYPLYDNARFSP